MFRRSPRPRVQAIVIPAVALIVTSESDLGQPAAKQAQSKSIELKLPAEIFEVQLSRARAGAQTSRSIERGEAVES